MCAADPAAVMLRGRREKKETEAQVRALATWQGQRDAYAQLLQLASTFRGESVPEIMLKSRELVFYVVSGASLVEDRRGKGHYAGRSTGVSIPVATIGGRSVRYRVGASRGHYVQGAPTPTAIDTGTVYVTNQRVIFQGARQTRECAFSKLIGFEHDDTAGETVFSVSNRQTPTRVHYGAQLVATFDFRLDLALAHFRGTVDELIGELRRELADVDAHRPISAPQA